MKNKITVQGELAKIKQSRQFMVMGLLLFAVAIVWVSVSLLTSQQRTKISPAQQEMAKPLQPTLNTAVIDSLSSEKFYSEDELRSFTIYKLLAAQDGSKVVVPIDTPEDALSNLETAAGDEGSDDDEGQPENSNLFESLIQPDASTNSAAEEVRTDGSTQTEGETSELEADPAAGPAAPVAPAENSGEFGAEI